MSPKKKKAGALLREFKGEDYAFGLGCYSRIGTMAATCGRRASIITSGVGKDWGEPIHEATRQSLAAASVGFAGEPIPGARPNSPREDVFRIAQALCKQNPDVIVSVGGGSCIDATKAAAAYSILGDKYPDLDVYFGIDQVSAMLVKEGRTTPPVVAAQLASGSAAHLTKYSNITDMQSVQKLLIIDEIIVPSKAVYDYGMSTTMSREFTMDGALDGVAHSLEVLYGVSNEKFDRARSVTLLGIDLLVNNLEAACDDPNDLDAREALGLGTDLGGYAIMIGGTNGAHLTSFSLVDILSHGRACALLNPYYTVFFAPAIEEKLRLVGAIYRNAGYTSSNLDRLSGRDLGLAVAEAMIAQSGKIGFPISLGEVEGFTDAHIVRALSAAKNPKLKSKLMNMPVPLSAEMVDDYMGPILEAAKAGNLGMIKNLDVTTT